jgi:hypothetical protein
MDTNNKKLSSPFQTWSFRIGLIIMGGWVAFAGSKGGPPVYAPIALFCCLLLYGVVKAFRLKTVELERDQFVISNFGRKITVPAVQVSEIAGGRNRAPIKLHFYEPTEFGNSIEFMAREPLALLWPTEPNPLVNELRQLCGLPTGSGEGRQ